MEIQYEKSAIKYLKGLQKPQRDLILEAIEMVKRLVLAWDPDYTRLTPTERMRLEQAENGEYINGKDINWDDGE